MITRSILMRAGTTRVKNLKRRSRKSGLETYHPSSLKLFQSHLSHLLHGLLACSGLDLRLVILPSGYQV